MLITLLLLMTEAFRAVLILKVHMHWPITLWWLLLLL
jgi:hypothetical protein